jgi:enoyl-CoA hydratase/carnithine racemase
MSTDLVLRQDDGGVARLTLNDPDRANVLSRAMMQALSERVGAAGADPDIRVIVLAAAGRIFCAGHDLGELRASDDRFEHEGIFAMCSDLMLAIGASPKPLIAKVQGAAVAAGCQLAASCDLAFAAESARFAVSGINLGLFCSTPAVALSRMVGRKAALEMLLTGRFVTAAEAAAMGLINRAAPAADLDRLVDEAAAAIAGKQPRVVALGKETFQQQIEMNIRDAYLLAGERMVENLAFPETRAGIDEFLKR